MRPISILTDVYLPGHYKIETGSGAVKYGKIWGYASKLKIDHLI